MQLVIEEFGEQCSLEAYLDVNGPQMSNEEIGALWRALSTSGHYIQDEGAGGVFHLHRVAEVCQHRTAHD